MLKNGVFRGSGTQFSTNAVNNILHAPSVGTATHTAVARLPEHQYQDNDPTALSGAHLTTTAEPSDCQTR